MNKKQLYESIMHNVKKALNESNLPEKSVMIIDNLAEYHVFGGYDITDYINIMMSWIFTLGINYIAFTSDFYEGTNGKIYNIDKITKTLICEKLYNNHKISFFISSAHNIPEVQREYCYNACLNVFDTLKHEGISDMFIISPGTNIGESFVRLYEDDEKYDKRFRYFRLKVILFDNRSKYKSLLLNHCNIPVYMFNDININSPEYPEHY